jgi:dinuclear metal center YbgI/SA1388 family protein
MARGNEPNPPPTIGQVIDRVLEPLAPLELSQSWDNTGLLVGDEQACCDGLLLCIDLSEEVIAEAVKLGLNLIMAYHPPLFKPISRVLAASRETDRLIWLAASNRLAVYSMHTALDAAEGGANDVLAEMIGLVDVEPFEHVPTGPEEKKLVTFVPAEQLEAVAEAVFQAGAGRIGDYQKCSYRLAGEGTFFGTEGTKPAVGQKGRLERVPEIRFECVVPAHRVGPVVEALCDAHPYEEPAFDVYPLDRRPARGLGRVGRLKKPETLAELAARLRAGTGATYTQMVGKPNRRLSRIAVCVGAAGRLTLDGPATRDIDATVTGEIRHHDALAYLRHGQCAVALGHWASERPALSALRKRIRSADGSLEVRVSRADRDPFTPALS